MLWMRGKLWLYHTKKCVNEEVEAIRFPVSDEWRVLYQIVLPQKYRHDVLSLVHEIPMAGHLGVKKTYCKVLNH